MHQSRGEGPHSAAARCLAVQNSGTREDRQQTEAGTMLRRQRRQQNPRPALWSCQPLSWEASSGPVCGCAGGGLVSWETLTGVGYGPSDRVLTSDAARR